MEPALAQPLPFTSAMHARDLAEPLSAFGVNGQRTEQGIWSWYLPTDQIPQAMNKWSRGQKQKAVTIQACASGNVVNCFSFACVRAGKIDGVEIATCYCPINEHLQGQPPSNPSFFTPAGQGNPDFCSKYPVGVPFPPGLN